MEQFKHKETTKTFPSMVPDTTHDEETDLYLEIIKSMRTFSIWE